MKIQYHLNSEIIEMFKEYYPVDQLNTRMEHKMSRMDSGYIEWNNWNLAWLYVILPSPANQKRREKQPNPSLHTERFKFLVILF